MDALEGRSLGVEPKVIGYFEGCHSSYKQQFPDVDLDWKRYRAFLGRVSGLEVLDIKGLCCKQQAVEVVDRALEQRLDTIVCACSGCSASLRNSGRGKVRVLSYPGLLARILGLEE